MNIETYCPEFLAKIEDIARQSGMRPGKVLGLWQDYELDPARNQALDPTVEEFVKDYAEFLSTPNPAPISFHKGQVVTVPLNGKPIIGRIVRKQGKTGYMVCIPWHASRQDFSTGKIIEYDTTRDAFFKTSDIQIYQATAESAA